MRATRSLLETRRYADINVAAILSASGTAKGSFYLYFARKEDLLAALVREAIADGLDAAESWTSSAANTDPVGALREGVAAGARLWERQAPVLRAIVEASGGDAELDGLWRQQMDRFTQAALARLDGDQEAAAWLAGRDPLPIVTALTWLGERVYYLAATGTPPFDSEQTVIDTLAEAWALALYGRRP